METWLRKPCLLIELKKEIDYQFLLGAIININQFSKLKKNNRIVT